MNIALGLKAHSGWAALVVIGLDLDSFEVLDRRRIELARDAWAKQPYHAAAGIEPSEARRLVQRAKEAARKHASREISAAVKRAAKNGQKIKACGVLVGAAMPDWTVDQILAVHFRMHKAEGVLFREALADAAIGCELLVTRIPEKTLVDDAVKTLKRSQRELTNELVALGKRSGPPWGKDQKEATIAAMIVLSAMSDEL